MGIRLVVENETIIFKNRKMNIDTFIGYLTHLVMTGCNLKLVKPLSGFTFTDKNGIFYILKLNDYEIEDYVNGIYSKMTMELHKLLLLQEQIKLLEKGKSK